MNTHFHDNPKWTEEQGLVLNSPPNVIVNGCAGSGKTLLACHLAIRRGHNESIAIIVYTKSLKAFIKDYLKSFGLQSVRVFHYVEWSGTQNQSFDTIIIDEFQDFSRADVNRIQLSASGVYFFGDDAQQIFSTNLRNEVTVNSKTLRELTNFRMLQLKANFRISKQNSQFISYVFPGCGLSEASFSLGQKPGFIRFHKIEHELAFLANFLKGNTEFKNIGVLLKRNRSFIGGHYAYYKLTKDIVYGVEEVKDYLIGEGLDIGFKLSSNEKLVFSKEVNINVMTIYSAKGLQFDCVILPFYSYINESMRDKLLTYVALTRSTSRILVTYTDLIADEFKVKFPKDSYLGEQITRNDINTNLIMQQLIQEAARKGRVFSEVEYYGFNNENNDTKDCLILKG